jgi:hypothetical protein
MAGIFAYFNYVIAIAKNIFKGTVARDGFCF